MLGPLPGGSNGLGFRLFSSIMLHPSNTQATSVVTSTPPWRHRKTAHTGVDTTDFDLHRGRQTGS
jgi:hypothetical protein